MASATPFEDLTSDFACPICLEWFWEPVALPCGHLYCQACIETAWRAPGREVVCPQCRKPFPERTYTPCRLLGTLIHRIRKMNRREAEEGRCGEAACTESGRHQNHAQFPEATKWYKKDKQSSGSKQTPTAGSTTAKLVLNPQGQQPKGELSAAVSQLESNLTRLMVFKRQEEEKLQNHKAIVLSLGDHISAELQQLHRFLYICEDAWKSKLNEEGGALLREAEARLTTLTETCLGAQELLLEARSHLQLQDSAGSLKGIPSLLNRVKQQRAIPAGPDLPPTLQMLGQFKGPIQYIAWKKMKSTLSVEFPHITLDPETAHPCLILSDDYTCVRDGHLRRDVPDTPLRFNYCVAVLGCQSFSSGKHYWEVEVGNKPSWTLGLVSISISRKGKIAASPANGYWVIRLQNGGELMAKDTPPQRLCPASFPKRVGVYLDYEGGMVSFYEAPTMIHLYTFATPRFLRTLLPYFCPGLYNSGENATPLKICYLPAL